MTTSMVAVFGALSIALGYGTGGDARQPMGVAVIGGLIFPRLLTLYVTPVFKVCKPELPCPDCGKPTVLFGFARLRKLIVDGIPQRNALRRVRCKNCEKTLSLLS